MSGCEYHTLHTIGTSSRMFRPDSSQKGTMFTSGTLLVLLSVALTNAQSCVPKQPRNCADINRLDRSSQNGVYSVLTSNSDALTVYCIFEDGYGYTFISPANTNPVVISDLTKETGHVMIRHRTTAGVQKQSKIEQIASYSSRPINVQYNAHYGYKGILNRAMTPYLYVGLLPIKGITHLHDTQGYRTNGVEKTFSNCDANPNSYFTFLFNQNSAAPVVYGPVSTSVATGWVDTAIVVPADQQIPDDYFTFFEMHMGGCGAYLQENHMAGVNGAALGLRFEFTCEELEPIPNGQLTGSGTSFGTTISYTCDAGYTLLSGDATRVCTASGQWSGTEPICGGERSSSYSVWSDWSSCQQTRQRVKYSMTGKDLIFEQSETLTKACGPAYLPRTCRDVEAVNGVYTLYNKQNQAYTVYCRFQGRYGYTYIAPTNTAAPSLSDIYEDGSHVVIRTRNIDGTQKEVRIEQISSYSKYPLSVQYNEHEGYNPILNKLMGPYVYVALLPIEGITHRLAVQGYTANGVEHKFTNGDGNPNTYFAFLHNHQDIAPVQYLGPNPFMSAWIDAAQPVSTKIPPSFFSFFEVHMGGGGGFISGNHYPNLSGAVVGLRFELKN